MSGEGVCSDSDELIGRRRGRVGYGTVPRALDSVTLLIPDLLGPLGELSFPALETLLARADRCAPVASRSAHEMLLHLFGIAPADDSDPPLAALTHLVDFEQGHDGFWLRADPVHLQPDLGQLLLFDSASFALSHGEAESLVGELHGVFREHGLALSVGHDATRWYVRLQTPPRIRTHPLDAAIGRHIDPFLPQGPEAGQWRRLGNDVQMILHVSPINAAREARGELPVNSVWFWGMGQLPPPGSAPWTVVWAGDAVARALARHTGCVCHPLPESAADWLNRGGAEGRALIVLPAGRPAHDPLDMPQGWLERLAQLEHCWFSPLLRLLRGRTLASLEIATGQCRFVAAAGRFHRIWRRRRPLRDYLGAASPG